MTCSYKKIRRKERNDMYKKQSTPIDDNVLVPNQSTEETTLHIIMFLSQLLAAFKRLNFHTTQYNSSISAHYSR